MIVGIGSDIVMIPRIQRLIEKWGDHFLNRLFTDGEIAYSSNCSTLEGQARRLAKRFAAKEAFVKALGTGFREGMFFKDIEVSNNGLGKPFFVLHKNVQNMIDSCLCPVSTCRIHLSLSDEKHMAMAFVVIETSS